VAWHDGEYACGHKGRVQIYGPSKDREWKQRYEFAKKCPDCREKDFAEKIKKDNQKAKEFSEKRGLPSLTGSDKQIDWATTLRHNFILAIEEEFEKVENNISSINESELKIFNHMKVAFENMIKAKTDSKFWIDSRTQRPTSILHEYADFSELVQKRDE